MKKQPFLIIGCLTFSLACNLPFLSPTVETPPTQTALPTQKVEPTAQASPTASPEPPPLYFTEDFDISSPYWDIVQAAGAQNAEITTSNGALQIVHTAPDTWLVGINTAHTYSNVFVRTKASLSASGSAGLICRYTPNAGWYELDIASNGTYSLLLGQWLSPGIAKYIPIISDNINSSSGVQGSEIGLFCSEGFLEIYLKDSLIRRYDATNYGLTEGNIGIASASFAEVPMTAFFEWVKVDEK